MGTIEHIIKRSNRLLPENEVIALIAYLHIVTCIQKDNFNLKRAEIIHRLQQLIDRQGQLYTVYER